MPRTCTPVNFTYVTKKKKEKTWHEAETKSETKSFPAHKVGLNPGTGVFSPSRGESRKVNLGSRKLPSALSDRRTLLLHSLHARTMRY